MSQSAIRLVFHTAFVYYQGPQAYGLILKLFRKTINSHVMLPCQSACKLNSMNRVLRKDPRNHKAD